MDQSLRQKAAFLYAQGVTTPEICLRLKLDFDTVMALLLPEPKEVASATPASKRPVGRPRTHLSDEHLSRILAIMCDRTTLPWTLPELVEELSRLVPHLPSIDTVRRELTRLGLTFSEQVRRLTQKPDLLGQRTTSKRALIYVVTHRTTRQLGLHAFSPATVAVGLTPGDRVALMVRPQSRMTPKFMREFTLGLSQLHPNRRIVVAIAKEGKLITDYICS